MFSQLLPQTFGREPQLALDLIQARDVEYRSHALVSGPGGALERRTPRATQGHSYTARTAGLNEPAVSAVQSVSSLRAAQRKSIGL